MAGYEIKPVTAIVTEENISVLGCVKFFESGSDNIYLVDGKGRYLYRAAQRGKSCIRRNSGQWTMEFSPLSPIVFNMEINNDNLPALEELGNVMFKLHPEANELPIVNSGGAIVCVARAKDNRNDFVPDWSYFDEVPSDMPKEKIYISCGQNPLLQDFTQVWQDRLTIEELNEDNWETVLSEQGDGVLLYESDVFPDCNKLNVRDLFCRCARAFNIANTCHNVELFTEPRDKILPIIGQSPEMSPFESDFLCGLLRKYRPQRILEIGVAAGATSAIVMQCEEMLGYPYEMYSVDLVREYYRFTRKEYKEEVESGFLIAKAKEVLPHANNKLFLGKLAIERMPEIGGKFDFLILDTTHSFPGEMLEFVSLLPYLKNGAVVVFHDVSLNWRDKIRTALSDAEIVTKLVLSTATAEVKYIPRDKSAQNHLEYPNIGALVIDDSTRKNIKDCFNALTTTWGYLPSREQIDAYRKGMRMFYGEECLWLFDAAVKCNRDLAGAVRK